MTYIAILNILIYIDLLIFLIMFFFIANIFLFTYKMVRDLFNWICVKVFQFIFIIFYEKTR
jgi:hypothetical protein